MVNETLIDVPRAVKYVRRRVLAPPNGPRSRSRPLSTGPRWTSGERRHFPRRRGRRVV